MGGPLLGFLECADKRSRLGDNGKQLTNLQMPEEQLKAFWEAIQADTALQQKLEIAKNDPDAIVALAKEAGFSISVDELKKSQSEISEEQLEDVAGGWGCFLTPDCL